MTTKVENILENHCVRALKESESSWSVNTFSTVRERIKKMIYANAYRNMINDGDSQTSPLPTFPEGGRTSVHRLKVFTLDFIKSDTKNKHLGRVVESWVKITQG